MYTLKMIEGLAEEVSQVVVPQGLPDLIGRHPAGRLVFPRRPQGSLMGLGQIEDDRLVHGHRPRPPGPAVPVSIADRELEPLDDVNVRQAGLFPGFSNGCVEGRFSGLDLSLRELPSATGLLEQQPHIAPVRLSHDQETGRKLRGWRVRRRHPFLHGDRRPARHGSTTSRRARAVSRKRTGVGGSKITSVRLWRVQAAGSHHTLVN